MDFFMQGNVVWGLILVFIGLSVLFNIPIWKYFWPLLIIGFGIALLFGAFSNGNPHRLGKGVDAAHDQKIEYSAVFSELNKKVVTEDFKGGEVNVVFAGGVLDLREAKIKKGETVDLEVNAIFGGIKVLVPETWAVNSSLTGVFGGFNNQAASPSKDKEQGRINLQGAAVFGGGEITNK